ncbi:MULTISPECIES: outer membrane protein assembly factor BamB family protein [Inquilinus]|uniref:Outer membrane protein assembly factor BamB n=1 Tax=Inquilinus ginsengisoli TaxID=363840 RepID=A0ABU1JN73_9PROT|nr:PQQ-binding-like beta-propeller repeat protein [Inquilinus ginsengisoli]MDR6289763.1 outer membrane protein assembly factor BamB [Inquilinus ginsengisoli]
MRRRHLLPRISILALAGFLSACGWFGGDDKVPLPGERISVLSRTEGLEVAPDAGQPAALPGVRTNPDWRNPGGAVNHVDGNLALNIPFQRIWSSSVGSGNSSTTALLTGPVIADGHVYVTDASGRLNSFDAETGRSQWRVQVADPEEDSVPIGGGAAYADGTVYVTTGFGEAVAVDPKNGGLIWRTKLAGPVRGAPTVTQGRVIAITIDNQTEVLDAKTGTKVWNHAGISESSALLGAGSAAVDNGVVVVPYSSGELFGLRIENGRPVWSANVGGGSTRAAGALAGLADITALPAIDGDLVVAVSHGNQAVGIDMRSGINVWEQPISGTQMPWIAGDTVYLVTLDGVVVALARNTGKVRWTRELDRWTDPEDKSGPISWTGPVLAKDTLILTSSTGQGVLISPKTGEITGNFETPETRIAPVIANGTLYILGTDGYLTAYR